MRNMIELDYDVFNTIDDELWNSGALDSAISRIDYTESNKLYEKYVFVDDSVICFVTHMRYHAHWIEVFTRVYDGTPYTFILSRLDKRY